MTVTVKKCHHSPKDLPPLCMTHIPALIPTLQYLSKSITSSTQGLPALCMTHIPALIPSLQYLSKSVTTHPQICQLYVWPIYQHSYHHYSNCQKVSPLTPRFATSVWPIYQHSQHHYSNCQKVSPITPRFTTSMCDPYTSTHTIITATVKKCHHSPPDLPPLCVTHIPALIQSLQQTRPSILCVTQKGLLCLYILYWVSKGLVCLYILEKVEIWSGVTDASQTHRQQNIELLSFSTVSSLSWVTQCQKCHHSPLDLPPLCVTHIPALIPSLQ